MSTLEVPGARLYYETHGRGPLLLLIAGAPGVADVYRAVTRHLAAHCTVAIYDRRGFSRSLLEGSQDYDRRLETDADDARRLIEHLGAGPAVVFGASSGALVGLELLARHPSAIRTLIPYEPPVTRLLSDGDTWVRFFSEVYDLHRRSGPEPAMTLFRKRTFAPYDHRYMADAPRNDANAAYWFEHELRQYPSATSASSPTPRHSPPHSSGRSDRQVCRSGCSTVSSSACPFHGRLKSDITLLSR